MTTHCWGVDPGFASSPTGVALVRFDGLAPHLVGAWTIRPRGRDWQARIDDVLGQLLALISPRVPVLAPRGPVLLSYELSYIGKNAQSALHLAQLGGGVRGVALALGLRVVAVQPSESKLALAGRGGATKQEMIDKARQVFGPGLSEHESDACGHAMAGEAKVRRQAVERSAT